MILKYRKSSLFFFHIALNDNYMTFLESGSVLMKL
jgi:hypothetical protein